MTGRVVDEQPADLGQQLPVAADAGQDMIGHLCRRRIHIGRRLSGGHVFDQHTQPPRVERLREVLVHAGGEAPLAIAFHRMRCHGDNRHVRAGRPLALADGARRLEAAHFGHLHVHQHDVERLRGQRGERFPAVVGNRDPMTAAFEQRRRQPLIDSIVLGQQQPEASLRQLRRQHRRR